MYSASPIPGDRRVYRCTIIAGDTRPRPHPEARYGRDGATIIEGTFIVRCLRRHTRREKCGRRIA
jgi:hypothetical protein